jgi:pimeloyl-ACP methyl ester carboxylesterase
MVTVSSHLRLLVRTNTMTDIRFVEARGLRFAYVEEGVGPLVLLVHGFPDTLHTWDTVRPALAQAGYRAVSPNTRGYWPTAIPTDGMYDVGTLGGDVLALIEALGARQAIIVGHDWGASAAYTAAIMDPERVRFLVTVAIPHPASVVPSPRLLWAVRHFFAFQSRKAEARTRAHDFAYVDELVQRWSPAWKVPTDETRPVKEAFAKPGCLEAALGYYRALSLRPSASQRRRITVSSVVFSGADDGVLRREDYERAARWHEGPHEIVHMPGGHFLHREHPERFIAELLRVIPKPGEV